VPEQRDEGFADEGPSIAHDDIMKRLLAYRQRLRGDAGADEAAMGTSPWPSIGTSPFPGAPPSVIATEELVDVGSVEAESPPSMGSESPPPTFGRARTASEAPSSPTDDLEERMAKLESTLERVDAMLGDLRRRFQELAVAADERIAAVRDAVAEARGDDEAP